MNKQIESLLTNDFGLIIVPRCGQVNDVKMNRQFLLLRDVVVGNLDIKDVKTQFDTHILREKPTYVSYSYKNIDNPLGQGTRHFVALTWNDNRDKITKRNDEFYDKAKLIIRNLLYSDYGKEKKMIYKKDMLKVLKELE